MAGIWQYPDLEELENFISRLILDAAQNVQSKGIPESEFVGDLSLGRALIIDEWGNGTAEFEADTVNTVLFFNFDAPPSEFDTTADVLTEEMARIIDQGEILVPTDLRQYTAGITFSAVPSDQLNDTLFNMTVSGMNFVFDLTNRVGIDLIEGRPPDEYDEVAVTQLRGEEEEEEPEEEPEEEEPAISVEDVPPLPEVLMPDIEVEERGPEYPEINENLRPFAVAPDTLEIPAGKEEKQIDAREPLDFEREMSLPGLQTTSQTQVRTMEEIAQPIGAGTLGETEPVGTYPRTGVYTRNYLKFRGPAYSYEIYKNLVYYSGYISTLHDINVRAGHYSSFREYMWVLEEIPQRGGPELIDSLTQQQAAAAGLETIPDHPSVDGAKAPWLERRQYYELVEENEEHEAWQNPYEYLHTTLDEDEN